MSYADDDMNEVDKSQSVRRCIGILVHACRCADEICDYRGCSKMKRVVNHTRICNHPKSSECSLCKQLIALCCYHAKHCKMVMDCPVPYCEMINNDLLEQCITKLNFEDDSVDSNAETSSDDSSYDDGSPASQLTPNDTLETLHINS